MPSWSEILSEIQARQAAIDSINAANPSDPSGHKLGANEVCKEYLHRLSVHTGRITFLYASCWLQKAQIPNDLLMVHPSDMDGFMEVVYHADKSNRNLDLIIHSPGGSPEAAEQIITYLRQKFDHIRVIVPTMAMSAATMMALSADEICMARHSTLGPTDPQFPLRSNTGEYRYVSTHSIQEEFKSAQDAANSTSPNSFAAWTPILSQYPPGIIAQADHSLALTTNLVKTWLRKYMLRGVSNRAHKARTLAKFFSGGHHHSHGRPLMREELDGKGLIISNLEDDPTQQDMVMSCYHAITHMFGGSVATKAIVANSGMGYIRTYNPNA